LNKTETQQEVPRGAIILARQVTPSQLTLLQNAGIGGLATVEGGPSSHVGILARSAGLAMLTGLSPAVLDVKNHETVILDAELGKLVFHPSQDLIAQTEKRVLERRELAALNMMASRDVCNTADGHHIEVLGNIGQVSDAEQALAMGAEGVGLLRSEFLFLDRQTAPSEKEQQQIYCRIVRALQDTKVKRPVIIRTLDVGGDKPLPYLPVPPEENPFLGVRGLRLSLIEQNIFRSQLRAILSVPELAQVKIMFPMVTSLAELFEARRILNEERERLGAPEVSVGIMIEVPSAAIMAETFAPHVDFFSIGSNDLTQYVLAIDRGHRELAKQADGLHPAVLELIRITAAAGQKHKKIVGVCGGIASDLQAVPLLIGLGVTELSVSVPSIPEVKACVRRLKKSNCRELAERALKLESAEQVREMMKGLKQ
jgi:phosphoenolpyruvate-protein phosphotransferase